MAEKVREILDQTARRLTWNRGLIIGVWTFSVMLALAAAFVAIDRLFAIGVGWSVPLGFGLALASVMTIVLAWLFRIRSWHAAIELDARARLAERLSTLASLSETMQQEPIGRALRSDVEQQLASIEVSERIPLVRPRGFWIPLIPVAAIILFALALSPIPSAKSAETSPNTESGDPRSKQQATELARRIEERKDAIAQTGLSEEVQSLVAEIERATKDIAANQSLDREDVALKLSDMAKAVEKRQSDGNSIRAIKQSLARLPRPDEGPATELQKSLRNGEFRDAAEQLNRLQQQIAKSDLSPESRDELAKQFEKLKEQIEKAAEQAEQIASQSRPDSGQGEVDRQKSTEANVNALQELAERLGECAKCSAASKEMDEPANSTEGRAGQPSEALVEQLEQAEEILRQLAQRDAEMDAIGELLDELNEGRGAMVGRPVAAEQATSGDGWDLSKGDRDGVRPERNPESNARRSRSQGKTGDGRSFVVGRVDGPNRDGTSRIETQDAISASSKEADEAITRQRVPREYKEHTRDYFDRLRDQSKP